MDGLMIDRAVLSRFCRGSYEERLQRVRKLISESATQFKSKTTPRVAATFLEHAIVLTTEGQSYRATISESKDGVLTLSKVEDVADLKAMGRDEITQLAIASVAEASKDITEGRVEDARKKFQESFELVERADPAVYFRGRLQETLKGSARVPTLFKNNRAKIRTLAESTGTKPFGGKAVTDFPEATAVIAEGVDYLEKFVKNRGTSLSEDKVGLIRSILSESKDIVRLVSEIAGIKPESDAELFGKTKEYAEALSFMGLFFAEAA